MKESTPRRIAAGALFTAAVGLSVGAICAPAQADAFTSHSAFPAAVSAYAPHQTDLGGRSFLPLGGMLNDRGRGGHDDSGVWALHGGDRDDRRVRVVDDEFYNDDHRRGDDRDCRPERVDPYPGERSIGFDVHPIDQVIRIGDDRRRGDDRDCRHDRIRRDDDDYFGSDYSVGYDVRRVDTDFLRIDDRHHSRHHGRDHDRRDCRHTPGWDAPRGR